MTRVLWSLFLSIVTSGVAIAGQFTTAINGSAPVAVSAITTDLAGNTYVVANADGHVSVSKIDVNGKVLFTDTFGGQGVDIGSAIAVDPSGNIYLAGATTSPDFPLSHPLQTQICTGRPISGQPVTTGFVTKISNDGSTILYSTFFGGTLGQSAISALAVDGAGNLYLTGYTHASDFPHTPGMPFGVLSQSPTIPGVIMSSISASGDKILYSGAIPMVPNCLEDGCAALHGGPQNQGVGIALDASGNAYVAGNAGTATGLPTTAGVLSPSGMGAFVAKINAGGTGLGYLTYLTPQAGIAPWNTLTAIAVDSTGNAYLGGQTNDPQFPVTSGSFESSFPQVSGAGFLAKLSPDGSGMVWASYFEPSRSIAIDSAGNVWANGTENLPNWPNTNGWTTGTEFLSALDGTGSRLVYSALYPAGAIAQSLAIDGLGLVHVAGLSGIVSAIAPLGVTTPQIFAFGAAGFGATSRLSPGEVIAVYGPGIGPTVPAIATAADGFYPTTVAGVQVSINGISMPLLYAGPNQINAVVPMGINADTAAEVRVMNGRTALAEYPVWIADSTAQSLEVVLNQDGSINSQANPAKIGSVVSFFATGWQASFFPLADGQVATGEQDFCRQRCTAGGIDAPVPFRNISQLSADVLYGGAATGLVAGITRFDVRVNSASPTLAASDEFTLSVQGPTSSGNPGPAISVGVWVTP